MRPLPNQIEIVPPTEPRRARIRLPGSKSITNRALALAALAQDTVTLQGALWSEDTEVMVAALQRLGFAIDVRPDPDEETNRTIEIRGLGGKIPRSGSPEHPLELFVGNAGTAARFLAALVCLGQGSYRLDGVPRMRERPQAELFRALRELGYGVESPNDRLPVTLHGVGPHPGSTQVSIRQSSQFASALLLVASAGGWDVQVDDHNNPESAYVAMTRALKETFPHGGGTFTVEPDASSGSYFWAMNFLLRHRFGDSAGIHLPHWPSSGWQIDQQFPKFLPLPQTISRQRDLGDSIMTAIVLAPFADHPVSFADLGRLRLQECERVQALRAELTRCGAGVVENGDTLTVHPSPLHGAEIETYQDHRMALCFATLALHVPDLHIKNPSCVAKTYPTFFRVLATPPPRGLGLTILNADTRHQLSPHDLLP